MTFKLARESELERKNQEIEKQMVEIKRQNAELERKDKEIEQRTVEIKRQTAELEHKDPELERKKGEVRRLEAHAYRCRATLSEVEGIAMRDCDDSRPETLALPLNVLDNLVVLIGADTLLDCVAATSHALRQAVRRGREKRGWDKWMEMQFIDQLTHKVDLALRVYMYCK